MTEYVDNNICLTSIHSFICIFLTVHRWARMSLAKLCTHLAHPLWLNVSIGRRRADRNWKLPRSASKRKHQTNTVSKIITCSMRCWPNAKYSPIGYMTSAKTFVPNWSHHVPMSSPKISTTIWAMRMCPIKRYCEASVEFVPTMTVRWIKTQHSCAAPMKWNCEWCKWILVACSHIHCSLAKQCWCKERIHAAPLYSLTKFSARSNWSRPIHQKYRITCSSLLWPVHTHRRTILRMAHCAILYLIAIRTSQMSWLWWDRFWMPNINAFKTDRCGRVSRISSGISWMS